MTGLLNDVRTLEFGDDGAAYVGKLLIDLGAHVTRLDPQDPPQGWLVDPSPAADRFLNRGKARVEGPQADLNARLFELLDERDVFVESGHPWSLSGLCDDPTIPERYPTLIRVRITPFGIEGPKSGYLGSDLVCAALGGFLRLGGYSDAPPTRAFGDQSLRMASLYAVGGMMVALVEREMSGLGQIVDVSVQEAVATALENSLQFFDLEGVVRQRTGQGYREAGTGVFSARDGLVYLMVGRLGTREGWSRLISWMRESEVEGADELAEPAWSDYAFRSSPDSEARFRVVFERFSSGFSSVDLYLECQERGIVLCPVSTPEQLLTNPHLIQRGFFRETENGLFPGPPFRIDERPSFRSDESVSR